jgi:nicotinate-nucleotide adenylyltransferase
LKAAARTERFDVIEVTVAGDPYQKSATGLVHPAAQRLAMAQAAFGGLDLVRVSDREIRRKGPSYTIDTVRELLTEFDDVDLIVGADLVGQIDSWRDAETLRSRAREVRPRSPRGGTATRSKWIRSTSRARSSEKSLKGPKI